MHFKKAGLHNFVLVQVSRVHVVQKLPNGNFEVELELADGVTL